MATKNRTLRDRRLGKGGGKGGGNSGSTSGSSNSSSSSGGSSSGGGGGSGSSSSGGGSGSSSNGGSGISSSNGGGSSGGGGGGGSSSWSGSDSNAGGSDNGSEASDVSGSSENGASATVQSRRNPLPAVISLITLLLTGCALFSRRRRRRKINKDGDMEESLVYTLSVQSQPEHWKIPVCKESGLPTEKSDIMMPVWLAPATFPMPQDEVKSIPRVTTKPERKETVMLVLVPKLATSTVAQNVEKEASIFPDLLSKEENQKEKKGQNDESQRREISNDSSGSSYEAEGFSPGLWVVPLSNESVASSLSRSVDDADSQSLESRERDDDSTATWLSKTEVEKRVGDDLRVDEKTEAADVPDRENESYQQIPDRTENEEYFSSASSAAIDESTISSLDGERSIGSTEEEI